MQNMFFGGGGLSMMAFLAIARAIGYGHFKPCLMRHHHSDVCIFLSRVTRVMGVLTFESDWACRFLSSDTRQKDTVSRF